MSDLPDAHFGTAAAPLPNWRTAPDDPDPDDEQIATPSDVTMMLGFDPANEADPSSVEPDKGAGSAGEGPLRKAIHAARRMILFAASR